MAHFSFRIMVKGRKEVVFLLCGSDESVHIFCEVSVTMYYTETHHISIISKTPTVY